jgi:DNA-binding beta-propeller fold protein YncE
VTATNPGGFSSPAVSTQTAVVIIATGVQHLEYVFEDGLISVYDMDHEQKLVKTISISQTKAGIRGMAVYPPTHTMFIFYGGDGFYEGQYNTGSVLAYDLVTEKVLWEVNLKKTGIDSGAVSTDGKRLYVPTGENDESGIWNILSTQNGALLGTIQGGKGAHNTVASLDGRYIYLGARNYNHLDVYETETGKVREIGPLVNGVRPFTVNGTDTLAFTTATNFDGFQVSSITTGKVLYTESFGEVPQGFPASAPSHGASLSPDEKQLYVIDGVHKEVQVWDVSKVAEGSAPTKLGAIAVSGLLNGNEAMCAYECQKGGWLQHSLDGRFVYVGDSGEVIDTATRKVITTLSTLANTKKCLEIDWEGGVPVATSTRTGLGYVG